jgi:hypothetical protein
MRKRLPHTKQILKNFEPQLLTNSLLKDEIRKQTFKKEKKKETTWVNLKPRL